MSDATDNLSPCPFCGGGETSIDERWTAPDMSGKDSLIGVRIYHWCAIAQPRPAQRLRIEVHGRDHADAAAAWNCRAALEGKP